MLGRECSIDGCTTLSSQTYMSPTTSSRTSRATKPFTLDDVSSNALTTRCPTGYDSDLYDPLAVSAVHVESTITLTHTALAGSVAYATSSTAWHTNPLPTAIDIRMVGIAREGGSARLVLWSGPGFEEFRSIIVPLGVVGALMVLL